MDLTIRDGSVADSALCWALYRRAVLEGAAPHYTEPQRQAWAGDAEEAPWMAERLGAGRVWVAEAGDGTRAAVGFLVASGLEAGGIGAQDTPATRTPAADKGAGPAVHLDLFFVRPDMRRAGVAPALYAAFEASAGARGGLLTADASLFLRPFLERRGWRMIEEEWVERAGVWLNRFRMEKRG